MRRILRISLCLVLLSLPLAGLQAQTFRCDDGIRPASPCGGGSQCGSCCCPEPSGCTCQAPARPETPSADHAVVPTPSHSLDDSAVLVVAVAHAFAAPDTPCFAAADSHPIQAHPEKLLARLHVLQI
jgi:hypothetical protein